MGLLLHGQDVESVFDLLGHDENGLTYALGLILSENHELVKSLANKISNKNYQCEDCEVRLQEFGPKDRGFTDIELLVDKSLFAIVEAKIGWNLPEQNQLDKYINRFEEYKPYERLLVIISECRNEYAKKELEALRVPVEYAYLSWSEILSLVKQAYSNSTAYQKRMLKHLGTYLRKVITMQDSNSNRVYCAVLTDVKPSFSKISWVDMVVKERKYFYPLGKHWPPNPPNYVAFRYKGNLMSIHHVDGYKIVTKMFEHLPVDKEEMEPQFLLELGEPFKPEKQVKNGNIYPNQRLWFDLDTVFVCQTIREARDLSKKRRT